MLKLLWVDCRLLPSVLCCDSLWLGEHVVGVICGFHCLQLFIVGPKVCLLPKAGICGLRQLVIGVGSWLLPSKSRVQQPGSTKRKAANEQASHGLIEWVIELAITCCWPGQAAYKTCTSARSLIAAHSCTPCLNIPHQCTATLLRQCNAPAFFTLQTRSQHLWHLAWLHCTGQLAA